MTELMWKLRLDAGKWTLFRCDERGEWHVVRHLTEREAQRLVHAIG
jgi:hypothetical protein